ncbi:MAG: ribosome small subunit-dependent GTPase A [Eubacterium sp.]|nr:ribosome small subunit-dependent GTPase A [Eubacterium sp.]
MTGKIVKGIAGFYYVSVAESGIYECKAKGIFRLEKIKPLVGDMVRIVVIDEADKTANIEEILPRKNELYRPAVANVDQALLIFALENPKPNLQVLDRFLIQMERQNLPVVICFNKNDLVPKEEAQHLVDVYTDAGYEAFSCSTRSEEDIARIRSLVKGKTTVLAGPSGVGKSSAVNALYGRQMMQTGEISRKLKKGRHTTRHSELFMPEEGTYLCDTPGFTSFLSEEMEKEDLRNCYPEFAAYEGKCRFSGCVDVDEPDCAVKEALKEGRIHQERYDTYTALYKELKEAEKNRY